MVYGGTVPEGSKVRFSMPPGSEIMDHAIEQMSEFNQQIPRADAIVLFFLQSSSSSTRPND